MVPDVVAVGGGVLADEVEFEYAVFEEGAGFAEDDLGGLGAHFAPYGGDGAEGAFLVAALADAEIGPVFGGEAEATGIAFKVADAVAVLTIDSETDGVQATRAGGLESIGFDPVGGRFVGLEGGSICGRTMHCIENMIAVEHTDHGVDAGRPLEQFCPVALHQAARDHNPLHRSLFFPFNRFGDDFQRFFFGIFEEAAGVDDDGVGGIVIGNKVDIGLNEGTEHGFGVDKVFRAAEGDEGDGFDGGFRHEGKGGVSD